MPNGLDMVSARMKGEAVRVERPLADTEYINING